MRALLDTCVVSELRRPEPDPLVRRRIAELSPGDTFVSVITIGEIAKGIALLPEGRRRREFESWLIALERQFESRILPIDLETGRVWGELTARAQKLGIQVPVNDGFIAATGLRHGLHVMTRNRRDFVATGALIVDPWGEWDQSSSIPRTLK